MNEKHELYLTQQGLESLKTIISTEPNNYKRLYDYIMTDLCYYPLQGRLVLNRHTKENENAQLRALLAERFKNREIRDVCYLHWLIIYLNHKNKIYLLDFISLKNTFSHAASIWNDDL